MRTHTYTQERILLPNALGKCCRTYQASGWPVAEACSLGLTCRFPAYLTLGCTSENAAVDSIWISHRISHQALAPVCGSHQRPRNPHSHCPCILGMSSQVSFPLPNQFSLPRVPCVLTRGHLSGMRGQQLAWS